MKTLMAVIAVAAVSLALPGHAATNASIQASKDVAGKSAPKAPEAPVTKGAPEKTQTNRDASPPPPKSDKQIAAGKAATKAARTAAGAAAGGTAGKVISGGPVGAAVGIILTPSEIACGPGETCAKDKSAKKSK